MSPMQARPMVILLADDDPDDRILTQDALSVASINHRLVTVDNGEELLDYLRKKGKYANRLDNDLPDIILLDLNMPKKNGYEALKELKEDTVLRAIPVVVLTTSREDHDVLSAYKQGVSGFIKKPVSFLSLVDAMRCVATYWSQVVTLPGEALEKLNHE